MKRSSFVNRLKATIVVSATQWFKLIDRLLVTGSFTKRQKPKTSGSRRMRSV